MTTVHSASLAAGAFSDPITVSALEPHGLNAPVEASVYAVSGDLRFHVCTCPADLGNADIAVAIAEIITM